MNDEDSKSDKQYRTKNAMLKRITSSYYSDTGEVLFKLELKTLDATLFSFVKFEDLKTLLKDVLQIKDKKIVDLSRVIDKPVKLTVVMSSTIFEEVTTVSNFIDPTKAIAVI
jgi:hypothetical protein